MEDELELIIDNGDHFMDEVEDFIELSDVDEFECKQSQQDQVKMEIEENQSAPDDTLIEQAKDLNQREQHRQFTQNGQADYLQQEQLIKDADKQSEQDENLNLKKPHKQLEIGSKQDELQEDQWYRGDVSDYEIRRFRELDQWEESDGWNQRDYYSPYNGGVRKQVSWNELRNSHHFETSRRLQPEHKFCIQPHDKRVQQRDVECNGNRWTGLGDEVQYQEEIQRRREEQALKERRKATFEDLHLLSKYRSTSEYESEEIQNLTYGKRRHRSRSASGYESDHGVTYKNSRNRSRSSFEKFPDRSDLNKIEDSYNFTGRFSFPQPPRSSTSPSLSKFQTRSQNQEQNPYNTQSQHLPRMYFKDEIFPPPPPPPHPTQCLSSDATDKPLPPRFPPPCPPPLPPSPLAQDEDMDFTFTSSVKSKEKCSNTQEKTVDSNKGKKPQVLNQQQKIVDMGNKLMSQLKVSQQMQVINTQQIVSSQNRLLDVKKKGGQIDSKQNKKDSSKTQKNAKSKSESPKSGDSDKQLTYGLLLNIKPRKKKRTPPLSDETWSGQVPSKYKVYSQTLNRRFVIPCDDMSKVGVVRVVYNLFTIEYEGAFNVYKVFLKDAQNKVMKELYKVDPWNRFGTLELQLKNLVEEHQWLDGRLVNFDARFLSSIWDGKTLLLQVNQSNFDDEVVDYLEEEAQRATNVGLGFDVNDEISILCLAPFKFREVFDNKLQLNGWSVPNLEELCNLSRLKNENSVLIAIVLETIQFRRMKSVDFCDPRVFDFLSGDLGVLV